MAKGGLGFVICREKDIDKHMSDIPQMKGMVLDSATSNYREVWIFQEDNTVLYFDSIGNKNHRRKRDFHEFFDWRIRQGRLKPLFAIIKLDFEKLNELKKKLEGP